MTSNQNPSPVPSQFAGCWHLTGGASSVPFLRIAPGGGYGVSGGIRPFTVSGDGQTLTWAGVDHVRHLGTGQTVLGVWRVGTGPDLEEYYFRDDGSVTYRDPTGDLPGNFDTLGDNSGGEMIYWELRAVISRMTEQGNGDYQTIAQTAFGGTFSLLMRITAPDLVINTGPGNVFTYEPVDCGTLT